MLSRRHIRIKVLHALYQYFQNEEMNMSRGVKRLEESIHNIYSLYLYELKALADIHRFAEDEIERKRNKKLPTQDDLNPNLKFVENSFLIWLRNNTDYAKQIEQNAITWGDNREALRRIFKEFEKSEDFQEYLQNGQHGVDDDKKLVMKLYGKYIVHNEVVHALYEEMDMHWADDLDAAQMMVTKTIKKYSQSKDEFSKLPRLIKDQDDMEFAVSLYRKVINNNSEYQELIHDKARNWEMDRIALIDIILMKLAIAELTNFKEIPVKVTLNEYIELGKEYSTPKSGNFINGILDKLKADLEEKGDIRKIGRGLL